MNNYKKLLLAISLFANTILCFAQEDSAAKKETSKSMLEEVIVTARKRAESIQETPVAVTVISGDSLRDQGILSAQELSKSVPSLQINNSTSPQIFIRGIGQRAPFARFDPSVSVYLDGIFIPRPDGQLLDTIDVDSVQVLRGPQGTLFGKNNTGGALVFTLTKPGEEFGGYLEGNVGNYNEQRVQAAVDLPVSDELLTRISVNTRRRDGFLKDVTGRENQSIDRLSAIFQSRWLASDDLTVDGFAFLGRTRENFPSFHCRMVSNDALFVNGLGILWPGDTDPSNPRAYRDNCEANSRESQSDLHTNQGDSQRQQKDQDELMFGLTFDYQFNENHSMKSIIGYRDATKFNPQTTADDGGPAEFLRADLLGDSIQESLTFELQFNGVFFDDIDYATGIFWQDEYKSERFNTSNPLVGAEPIAFLGLAAGQEGVDLEGLTDLLGSITSLIPGGTVPLVAGAAPLATVQDFDIDGQTFAAFAQATWHLTDHFELTLGGRYTEETRESYLETRGADLAEVTSIISSADPRFVPILPDMAAMAFLGTWSQDPLTIANNILRERFPGDIRAPLLDAKIDSRSDTFRQFTPMASAAYIFPESLLDGGIISSAMVYATWSNGFKSGFQEPFGLDGLTVVEPEELENREIGIKIDALERSLRVNIAAYSMVFKNMHLITVNVDSNNALVVGSQNAGASTIDGIELEVMWFPSMNAMINLTYSNNNYRYEEFMDNDLKSLALRGEFVPIDRSDEEFAVSPEETAALGIQYTIETDIGRFVPRLDASYKSDIYLGLDRGAWAASKQDKSLAYADAYFLYDARVSWTGDDEDLTISAYVKNLTDERYDIGAVSAGDSIGTFTSVLGDPRTYGLELRKTI
ncbi:Pesticin receptor [Zhongshania aliphaticivorans]|uniref:Pesticin receptor n=1 Tax=Zhongshania aliphaticivorans TaxID=1470434 RepID=A0A5S9Q1I3_9GAMM|nr:TonB-dependent receptor [Zhongshania aliphaticivorans]CAA0110665.1 Pesticin receptor [Zhongshania aliphaticivorans]CAA0118239.1 Pesticin receptor [Zhongshania aliphaticivorans]CAA0122258.1 Pesticin receptor [Zhongshania aliphaticivorans]